MTEKEKEALRTYKREQMRRLRRNTVYREREYARNREYQKNNRPRINEIQRRFRKRKKHDPIWKAQQKVTARACYQRLREKLFRIYGGQCSCCQESETLFLELDHVYGGGAKEYQTRHPTEVYREVVKNGKSNKYTILCSNCNRGRQRNGGICPHQKLRQPNAL